MVIHLIETYQNKAKVFKAFCDENRLIILEMLQSGEKCACKLLDELKISQSTLSHHMKILCESGIVSSRKEGSIKALALLAELTNTTKDNTVSSRK